MQVGTVTMVMVGEDSCARTRRNQSLKFRAALNRTMARGFGDETYSWMLDEVGTRFPSPEAMAAECAESVGCSRVTASRWIRQYSGENGAYRILTDSEGNRVIRQRD